MMIQFDGEKFGLVNDSSIYIYSTPTLYIYISYNSILYIYTDTRWWIQRFVGNFLLRSLGEMLCFFKDGWLNHLSPSFLIPFSIKLGLFEFSLLGNSFEVVEVYGATADWFPRENIRLNEGILFNTCFAFHSFQSNGCVVLCIF